MNEVTYIMEANVRQIIDSKLLTEIIPLPEAYKNILVEIIITPAKIPAKQSNLTRTMLQKKLNGSHTQLLSGVISGSGISLDEIRAERRQKYESLA